MAECWDSMAPTTSEASTSMTNCSLGSGRIRMGTDVKRSLESLLNLGGPLKRGTKRGNAEGQQQNCRYG